MQLPPFQTLLDAHGRDVHRFLIASVGAVDADDCYQETWISALRGYPKLRDASNLRGWLLTIAHRKVIDHARSRARRPVPVAAVAEIADAAASSTAVHAPSVTFDRALWDRVARLPAKQRTAVALRFITDSPYSEIGKVMGTSEEAARRNVFEALTRLRKDQLT